MVYFSAHYNHQNNNKTIHKKPKYSSLFPNRKYIRKSKSYHYDYNGINYLKYCKHFFFILPSSSWTLPLHDSGYLREPARNARSRRKSFLLLRSWSEGRCYKDRGYSWEAQPQPAAFRL